MTIKKTVNRLIIANIELGQFDREVKKLEKEKGIDTLREEIAMLIDQVRDHSKENREAHDLEGDHGTVTVRKVSLKVDSMKPSLAVPILQKFVDQGRLAQSKFDQCVTKGIGDKKRTVLVSWDILA